MRTAQVTDHRLHLGADPPRMRLRRMRAVSQAVNTALPVTSHPPVHRLAGHPETLGNLSDRNAIKDLKDGAISLLDHVQLPQHEQECQASNGVHV
jgi:hypothetical protein